MESNSDESLARALRSCESEPIHLLGQIQPHGALIAVGRDRQRTILHVSANLSAFFPIPAEDALGRPLHELVGADQAGLIDAACRQATEVSHRSQHLYSVVHDEVIELHATIHRTDTFYLIEVERIQTRLENPGELFRQARDDLLQFDHGDDVVGYCGSIAEFVRQIIGFDRVMIYRFDTNWDGEVIAESRAEDATSYLGNRFPAGDIPPQARALYLRNTLRTVSDISAATVPVIPAIDPLSGTPLDLTFSVLRAFSPVHVEYLHNMGVRASASISILLHGKLWGLVACHHGKPAMISHSVRDMMGFVGKIVSMKLTGLEALRQATQGNRLGKTLTKVIDHLLDAGEVSESIGQHQAEILNLVNATGALVISGATRFTLGTVPAEGQLDRFLAWLDAQPENNHLVTDHLAGLMPGAEQFAEAAAGCLATPIRHPGQSVLIWFRPEKLRLVKWAGRPEKQIVEDDAGMPHISPRRSFAVWSETWRNRCDPWTPEEVASGVVLGKVLSYVLLRSATSTSSLPAS